PESEVTLADCELQNWQNVRPCFVLSTGRSGTLLLNQLLQLSPAAAAHHQPSPELIRASKRAYEEIRQSPEVFCEVLKSAREELILQAAQRNKVYIETNNRITFFAPVIPDVFPQAVFIHLTRHPGAFVRSGIRRRWYSGKHEHDVGRPEPLEPEMKTKWKQFTQVEKIGWLWNETNRFIEDFKKEVNPERVLQIKAENLFSDPQTTEKIFAFLHLPPISRQRIAKKLKTPVNVQKKGEFPKYSDWPPEIKEQLRKVVPIASRYGYSL
ncbi:MAG: sulfotransferase, partial [Calditrichia bacterium]